MALLIKERARHLVLALLLSVGLVMPLAGSLDEALCSFQTLYVIGAVCLAFEIASLHRIAAWGAALAAAAGTAVWIFRLAGAQTLSDAGIAISLRMQGNLTAVPLAAEPVSILLSCILTVLCCFATLRKATCIPAVILCTIVFMIVWLTDSMNLLPWLMPALVSVLTLILTFRHEDTSALRVLPWAAGLVALAYILAGNGPASTPLKEKADEVRQAILDRLFFTEARDVFSLYSVGLSPQGADQLGGKPNPSDRPVMQVSTPKKVYLRGTVYNRYTGHGWQNTTGGRRYLWQSRTMAEARAALFDEALPPASVQNSLSEPYTISVRMLSGSASTLFVPQRIRELNPGGETVPYFSNSSEIFITRNLQAGDTWEAAAPLYAPTDPGIGPLTEICGTLEDPRRDNIYNTYLELPDHLEKPVFDLAAEITAMADTPFEKATALQNYLTRNYKYSLDVGEHPENIDFVTSFLLDTRKGYCTYFASAMTVLCRMAGLPARYVEGYLAEPNEHGEALVTGLNAHAWTEVYFQGFGWLTFDATPGQHGAGSEGVGSQNKPTPTPEPETPPTPEPDADETTEQDQEATPGPDSEQPAEETPEIPPDHPQDAPEPQEDPGDPPADTQRSRFPWWLAVIAAAAAAALRIRMTSPFFLEKRAGTETGRYDIWAEEIALLLKAEQMERRNGETPMAFARRVDGTGMFSESLTPAGECLSLIRYSRAEALETDTALMRDTAMLLRSEISKRGRLRYWIQRIFRSRKKAESGKPLRRKGLTDRKRLVKQRNQKYNKKGSE